MREVPRWTPVSAIVGALYRVTKLAQLGDFSSTKGRKKKMLPLEPDN